MRIAYLVFLLAATLAGGAFADAARTTAKLRWTPPTARVDGTAMDPATELDGYILTCGDRETDIPANADNGGYPLLKSDVLPGFGTYDCYLQAVDLNGQVSLPSNSDSVPWIPVAPSAPTNFVYFVEEVVE